MERDKIEWEQSGQVRWEMEIIMVKYIYKSVILLFIFAGALFYFGHGMKTDMAESTAEVSVSEETNPYMQLRTCLLYTSVAADD